MTKMNKNDENDKIKNLTIKKKEISVKELVEYYLKNIEDKNKKLNVYLEVYDDVLEQAEIAQKKIDSGKSSLLTGIPLAIKDNILIKGRKVSAASKILEGFVAPYNATVIEKLLKESPVFLGRTNCDEFAMGSSTENSAFGVTRNPYNLERVSGGSSGGSSAAIASNMAMATLGSDTGGSIRQPASFCGVVGLKPTYGRVSRNGLIAMGSSLDCIGPIGKSVSDVEIIFNSISGKDPNDSTTISGDDYKSSNKDHLRPGEEKRVIGIPRSLIEGEGVSSEVKKNFEESIRKLEDLGYKVKDIEIPHINYSLPAYYIIMPAEASSNLSRFDGVKYGLHESGRDLLEDYYKTRGVGFGKEVKRRIILGTYVLSSGYYDAYYGKANIVRNLIREEFSEKFKEVDLIVTPTTPTPAWKIGEKSTPLGAYLADIFTVTANITGLPAISIPSRMSTDGLPLGIQFVAPHCREDILFGVGKKFLNEI